MTVLGKTLGWFVLMWAWAVGAWADPVRVAVAANFAAPMQQIAQSFERETGHQALVSLGSTGQLYAQIVNGAPFQVLLAADDETPQKLEQMGLAIPNSRFTYATGALVLWSREPGVVDAQGEVLRRGNFERLAIANPKLAPYGAAAWDTMKALGVLPRWQARLVQGDNIAQTYQFVATGNAPLGFVALSQVMRDGRISQGSAWRVPAELHAPLRQDAVLLRKGQGDAAALALMAYLRSETSQTILRGFGYVP